jgi:hypothetical protein
MPGIDHRFPIATVHVPDFVEFPLASTRGQ